MFITVYYKGKNLVSDGHFCTSFCPAQPKISISGDLKHCYHVLTYPDQVMSKNHDLLQNKRLRNQLLMAASVMEFPSTTLKNVLVEKILLLNQGGTINDQSQKIKIGVLQRCCPHKNRAKMLKDLCPISKITPGHCDFSIWACSAL